VEPLSPRVRAGDRGGLGRAARRHHLAVRLRTIAIADQTVRRLASADLTEEERAAVRELLWSAFADDDDGGFTEADWDHAVGGTHVIAEQGGRIMAHASVVERTIHVGERPLRTGYVEAVATAPDAQGSGFGTLVMEEIGAIIREGYELGTLGTGAHRFYERLGWETWPGHAFVRTPGGVERTPDEEGFIMILRTPATPDLDPAAPISCQWRPGDVW
jgi:aminoglycoside 2'-N-acetyltransferase I